MNLVRAEVERLAARRFVQLMLVLLALAFAITTATTLVGSHQPSARELAAAEAQLAQVIRGMETDHEYCLRVKAGELPVEEHRYLPADCSEIDPVLRDQLPVVADYLSGVFVFGQQAGSLLYFLIAFLVLFGFLVGASYIGADLNSGGVVNLLLWRPRRLTVLGAKLGTLLGVVTLLAVVATVVYLGTFWTIAQAAGLPGQLDGAFWQDLASRYGRGLVLVLLATALGFGIATLGRHTSAALGAVAAYAVVWELGARVVFEIIDVARPDTLMLSTYIGAWLTGRMELYDDHACLNSSAFDICDGRYTITWAPALLVLLALAGAVTAAAFAVFRRRDLI
ncbi:ABC-2 type transport system permease protein [Micromonospora sp. A200]|uniref:ABC transporter permease subunit n=1 Tax=Micromonospora sp. A200 TaxID=2940568 RepID=UPI00247586A7|nr:ABC transporter permease subunit [Micromonospora sp. A200]MDH6465271.1 ABC-2 type transport system permease protein [Micromonospora sp. A200]